MHEESYSSSSSSVCVAIPSKPSLHHPKYSSRLDASTTLLEVGGGLSIKTLIPRLLLKEQYYLYNYTTTTQSRSKEFSVHVSGAAPTYNVRATQLWRGPLNDRYRTFRRLTSPSTRGTFKAESSHRKEWLIKHVFEWDRDRRPAYLLRITR